MRNKIKILEDFVKRFEKNIDDFVDEDGVVGGYLFLCLHIPEINESDNKLRDLKECKIFEAMSLCGGITYKNTQKTCTAFQKVRSGKTGILNHLDYRNADTIELDIKEYNEWKIEIAKKAIELLKGI